MNITQYKVLILSSGKIETRGFDVHHGANMNGSAGVSKLRALELVNKWNQSSHLYMTEQRYVYWVERC